MSLGSLENLVHQSFRKSFEARQSILMIASYLQFSLLKCFSEFSHAAMRPDEW